MKNPDPVERRPAAGTGKKPARKTAVRAVNKAAAAAGKKTADRKKTGRFLRTDPAVLSAIFESSPIAIAVTRIKDNKIVLVNRAWEKLTGYSEREAFGHTSHELGIIPRSKERETVLRRLSSIERVREFDATLRSRSGALIFVSMSAETIEAAGEPCLLTMAVDITGRRQAELERARLMDILDQSQDEIYLFDSRTLKFKYVNRIALHNLGYTWEEMMGMTMADIMSGNTKASIRMRIKPLIEGREKKLVIQRPQKRKDGTEYPVEVYLQLHEEEEGRSDFFAIVNDISSRNKAEHALRTSEERFRTIAVFSRDIVYDFQVKTGKVAWDGAIEQVTGYLPQEFENVDFNGWAAMVHPDDREEAVRTYLEAIAAGEPYFKQYRFLRKNGGFRWIEEEAYVIKGPDGRPLRYLGIMKDITERKLAEEAVRNSEYLLKETQRISRVGGWEYDPLTGRSVFTEKVHEIFGTRIASTEEAIAMFHPDDRPVLRKAFDQTVSENRPYDLDLRLIRADGGTIWVNTSGEPMAEDGRVVKVRGFIMDINERKLMEEALKESRESYRVLFEDNAAAMILIDPDTGSILNANQAAVVFYGWPRDALTRMKIWQLNTLPPEEVRERMEDVRREGKFHFEFRHRLADGSTRDVEVFSRRIERNDKPVLYSIIHDITERKKAEAELQETLESLRRAVGTTIQVLIAALQTRDPYTASHQLRVTDLACAIAGEMDLPKDRIEGLRFASAIHDIGKLSIPAEILSKPTRLSNIEYSLIKEHPRCGFEMLKDVSSQWPLAEIVLQHHERVDGSGYPNHLKGDEIILEARIVAVADVVEAMASHRPYRPALGLDAALAEIENKSGTLYDRTVADVCLRLFREKGYKFP